MKPSRVERTSTLLLADDADSRIAVVSDTHARPHPKLLDHLTALAPVAILHAGDVGDRATVDRLAEVAPLHAVRGNVDSRALDLPDDLILSIDAGDRSLRLLVTHIGQHGARLRSEVVARARRHRAALVVCGHSHLPFIGGHDGLTVFNPGSAGPRRFDLPVVFGVLEVSGGGVRLGHIDCETGRPWTPPSR